MAQRPTGESPADARVVAYAQQCFGDDVRCRVMRRQVNYMSGTLYYLEARSEARNWGRQCYVFESRGDRSFFASPEEFLIWLGEHRRVEKTTTDLVSVIAGIIAIMITSVICAAFYFQHAEPPVYLTGALATILGFYFGRSTLTRRELSSTHDGQTDQAMRKP